MKPVHFELKFLPFCWRLEKCINFQNSENYKILSVDMDRICVVSKFL